MSADHSPRLFRRVLILATGAIAATASIAGWLLLLPGQMATLAQRRPEWAKPQPAPPPELARPHADARDAARREIEQPKPPPAPPPEPARPHADARSSARREIERWIDDYRQAYQQKNVDRLIALGVVPAAQRGRMTQILDDLQDLEVRIDSPRVEVQGDDVATVALTRVDRFSVGDRFEETVTPIRKMLRKRNGEWVAHGAALMPEPAISGENMPTQRTGGRRVPPRPTSDDYVLYLADTQLQFLRLNAIMAERKLAVTVSTFVQRLVAQSSTSDFDVTRGGELVSLAIARQLEAMGWDVTLEDADKPQGAARTGRIPMLDSESSEARPRARRLQKSSLNELLDELQLGGDVVYYVESRPDSSAGILAGSVTFKGMEGDTVYSTALDVREEIDASVASITKRARKAASAVLHTFVRRLLIDPRLEDALVRRVNSRLADHWRAQ